MKLHIGCGYNKKEGYLNCDISPLVHPDKLVDITKTLPFKDNSVEEIIIYHVLEHTHEPLNVLKEFYRVCKKDAIIKICVPYFSSQAAFSMLDHYSFFTWTSFDLLDPKHQCHWQGVGQFNVIYKKLIFRKCFILFELLFNAHPLIARIYQELFCWIVPANELKVNLKVIK